MQGGWWWGDTGSLVIFNAVRDTKATLFVLNIYRFPGYPVAMIVSDKMYAKEDTRLEMERKKYTSLRSKVILNANILPIH